jgi:hypothetical protein
MYIIKLLLNVVTAGNEARLIREQVFFMPVPKKSAACELSHVLYLETPQKLCRAIKNKRCGMLTSGVVLLPDCASAYSCSH